MKKTLLICGIIAVIVHTTCVYSYPQHDYAKYNFNPGYKNKHAHRDDEEHIDYYVHPKYSFKYGVEDRETGDFKSAQEYRDGDAVRGSYTVYDPDGTIRTVEYTADKDTGFNAIVHKSGQAGHPHYGSDRYGYSSSY